MKMYEWTGHRTQNPCISTKVLHHWAIQANIYGRSSPNYYIPPLTLIFCPPRNTHEHVHPVMTYWFNKCLIKDNHSTKFKIEERKVVINNCLHKKKENVWTHEKYWNDFLKIAQTLFLIYIHVPILDFGEHVDLR